MSDRALRSLGAVGLVAVLAFAVFGLVARSGPATRPLGRAERVVLVSVPGLQWDDLEAIDTPSIDGLIGAGALLSVRAIGPETSLVEGYLTINAGNRVEIAHDSGNGSAVPATAARCTALVATAIEAANDDLNGAEPGALGDALHGSGRTTAVVGGAEAVLALADSSGCVDVVMSVAPAVFTADVSLVELSGLERVRPAAERAKMLRDVDHAVEALPIDSTDIVFLLAPVAPDDGGEVTVFGIRPPTAATAVAGAGALAVSATTRRAGYVTNTDIAPSILSAFGIDIPSSMSGTAIALTNGHDDGADDGAHDSSWFADLADRVSFRDRAVGPVSVVFVVLLSLCGLFALARRTRLARTLGPIVVAYPTVCFLCGLVAYHRMPLDFVVVAVPTVAALVAAIATASWSRWGPAAATGALAAILWCVLLIDITTGGRLQINTVLGYTPTIAGRFQGFGNMAFGLFASAAIVVAVAPLQLGVRRTAATGWAAFVGAVTVIADAMPAFGSDVGGTLALIPAFTVVVLAVAGRRIDWKRLIAGGLAGVVALVALAFADRSRPAASRTHLGRFADSLLDGDGGLLVRRKLRSNLAILTSSFWSIVLLVILVGAVVVVWRSRERLFTSLAGRPAMRAFVVGSAVAGGFGFALNDSGIAVPGVMLGLFVPWLVAVLLPPMARRRAA